jgi:hypothetical protein
LQIEEVAFAGSDDEYVVLMNVGAADLTLDGWLLGDAATPGDAEGLVALPPATLAPGALYSIAREAATFYARFGRWPDAAMATAGSPVTPLARRPGLATGMFALNDSGDEVLLLDPGLVLADAVAYGAGDYAALHLSGYLQPVGDYTLQRVPPAAFPAEPDVRQRFLLAPAHPFEARGLPLPALAPPVPLDDGMIGVWGTLGAHSNFTAGFSAPPHYVLAAAAAQGLQFVALADLGVAAPPLQLPAGAAWLPAWGWQGDGEGAVIYDSRPAAAWTLNALAGHLSESGAPVQWQGKGNPYLGALAALAADDSRGEKLPDLFDVWRAMGAPLLPAGNAQPDLPGAVAVNPRFTGLVSSSAEPAALLGALAAGRGWLTSDADTWLTLRAETTAGGSFWMGSWLPAANAVTLHVFYGDGDGEPATLALWQNGAPLQQLLIPPGDGRWSIRVPALGGALLAAVATQADGDFAVTAPLQVAQPPSGEVRINEALPAPAADLNQDGGRDSQDEFIELWNPGAEPVALAGWQLVDVQGEAEGGHRFTFGAGDLILGGQRLLLWRSRTRLSLDNGGDRLRLLDASGAERDVVAWDATLPTGCAAARLPDGSGAPTGTAPTPGEPNYAAPCGDGHASLGETHTPASNPWGDLPPIPTLEPTHGQAGGAPGSVAQSKLAGLAAAVELNGVVTAPPGLFNGMMYIADVTGDGVTAGIGVAVYLNRGEFPPLAEGDLVHLAGRWHSYRGEMELVVEGPEQVWKLSAGTPLRPLALAAHEVCESVEGRLVTLRGVIAGWQGDSIFLADPAQPDAEPLRVTVRSSLPFKRPYVNRGEVWQVTGIVSQFARQSPWNDGYRLLVRYPQDMVCVSASP